jgi:type I restriction enzyme S subunit
VITLSLENCMDAIIDYRGKTPRKTSDGIPLITAKIVKGGRIETPEEFIDPSEYDEWMRRGLPRVGDVVITTEAPLGEVAQLSDSRIALAQRLILLRGKPGLLDNTYLKYLLMSDGMQGQLGSRASGTTVVGIKQSELRKVTLALPAIQEQEAIAAVLGSLDDKIEQNRRTSQKLEALSRAVFKAWFVDFEPVKAKAAGATASPGMPPETFATLPTTFQPSPLGPVPQGWEVKPATDVATVAIGKTPPRKEPQWFSTDPSDLRWVSISDMGSCGVFIRNTSEYLTAAGVERYNVRRIPDRSVLFSFKLTVGRVAIADGETTSNEAIAHFVPLALDALGTEYLYCYLSSFDHTLLGSTSSIATATNSKTVKAMPVLVPDTVTATSFTITVRPLFDLMRSLSRESAKLATLRDYLLPRLLSGRVRVGETALPRHNSEKG